MKPAASAWLYTSSSSNVTKSSLYKEYGEVAPAEIMLPLYNLSFTSPVTVFEFHQRMLAKRSSMVRTTCHRIQVQRIC